MSRRLIIWLAIPIGFVLGVWLYTYAYDHIRIVRLDNLYDPQYGYPVGREEQHFNQNFPSSSEIKTYLSNSTILHSRPPIGNEVFYFDENYGFVIWYGNTIEAGRWWLSPRLQLLLLGERWRLAIVQTFCMSFSNRSEISQQDTCYSVQTLVSLLARGRGTRHEYRKGNAFGLAPDKSAPFQLPMNSEISIDSLSAANSTGRGN